MADGAGQEEEAAETGSVGTATGAEEGAATEEVDVGREGGMTVEMEEEDEEFEEETADAGVDRAEE